jgi:hypothetical protein
MEGEAMTSSVCKTLLLAAGLLLVATATAAAVGLPDPMQSVVPPVMVGSCSGTVIDDTYVVIVRDVGGAPVGGALVTIDFSTAAFNSGTSNPAWVHFPQLPPTTWNCPTYTITQVADASGVAVFEGMFGGAENTPSIQVSANAVPLRVIEVRSTDMDANGETGLVDLNGLRINFFTFPLAKESDWDQSGLTDLGDLNILRQEFFSGGAVTRCP